MIIEQDIDPKLKSALLTHGKLGRYSYAPPLSRSMLELSHSLATFQALSLEDPVKIRGEKALITYYSSPYTLTQTAETLGYTRETIRKGIRASLATRHFYLAPIHQQLYPLNQLLAIEHKYLPTEHKLLIVGNMGGRMIEAIENGADFDQMASLLSLPHHSLIKRLRLLRQLDIKIPRIPNSLIENQLVVKELQDQSKNDEEVQEALDQVTHGLYDLNRLAPEPFLIAITNVARDLGYQVYGRNSNQFIEVVKLKVPISPEFVTGTQNGYTHRYRFAVAWHEDRIKKVIKEEESLAKYLSD